MKFYYARNFRTHTKKLTEQIDENFESSQDKLQEEIVSISSTRSISIENVREGKSREDKEINFIATINFSLCLSFVYGESWASKKCYLCVSSFPLMEWVFFFIPDAVFEIYCDKICCSETRSIEISGNFQKNWEETGARLLLRPAAILLPTSIRCLPFSTTQTHRAWSIQDSLIS